MTVVDEWRPCYAPTLCSYGNCAKAVLSAHHDYCSAHYRLVKLNEAQRLRRKGQGVEPIRKRRASIEATRQRYDGWRSRSLSAHKARLGNYRMDLAEWKELLDAQQGECAICGERLKHPYDLVVDHDHSCCIRPTTCGHCTRGLLCNGCNVLLGRMSDDVELLRQRARRALRAVEYLTGESSP